MRPGRCRYRVRRAGGAPRALARPMPLLKRPQVSAPGVSDSRLGVSETRLGVSDTRLGVSNTLQRVSHTRPVDTRCAGREAHRERWPVRCPCWRHNRLRALVSRERQDVTSPWNKRDERLRALGERKTIGCGPLEQEIQQVTSPDPSLITRPCFREGNTLQGVNIFAYRMSQAKARIWL